MDFMNLLLSDDFKNLSDEEKHETVSNLIHEIMKDSGTHAVLFNPIEHKTCSLGEIIETVGEDSLIEMIIEGIENCDGKPQSFTQEEVNKAITNLRNGTATNRDIEILDMYKSIMEDSETVQISKNLTSVIVSIIGFAQNCRKYFPSIGDLLTTFNILSHVTCIHSEDSSLYKYKDSGYEVTYNMINSTANDILDAWKNTCTELPDKYIMVCALLEAAKRFANDIKLCDVKVYKETLGDILEDIDLFDDDNECDCCHNECEGECNCENSNGSNKESKIQNTMKHKTYNSKDENMRNILKD